jgi:phosphoribosylformylglycinamidine (FGAM) synthase PurS component
MKAHVWVMPKRTVLDPQGQTIHNALAGLGYEVSKDVLTNPVIEEYRFEIVD